MTQAEKETIETFCNELSLALRQITGKTYDLRPDLLARDVRGEEQPEKALLAARDSDNDPQ